MGTVRKNPRGTGWQVRYRDASGKQRTKVLDTKGEANGYLQTLETEMKRKTWVDPALGKLTFSDYAAAWRESTAHLRPGSVVNLDSRLRRHIIPAFGTAKIGNIQPFDVRGWVAQLTGQGLAPATVKATYGVFSRIMSTAVVDGLIPRSPCIGVKLPRNTHHQEMHFLNPEQVTELAETIGDRYRALIYTAAYTGMRWGELAGLQTKRCNVLRGNIDVVESLTEVNGNLDLGPTKNGKARSLTIPRFLGLLLTDHMATYGTPGGFIFTSAEGLPLRRNFYRRHFKPTVRKCDVPDALRFHDLRHTHVAFLIAQGAHPKEIQERLGHSTIKLTFDRYGHLLPTLDNRLRDGLDELWQQSNEPPEEGGMAAIG